MTFCSECGKKQAGYSQFFEVGGEPYCEACVARIDPTGSTPVKPVGSRSGRYLYSTSSIATASFLGSPVAGGWLMSSNFLELGNPRAASHARGWSMLATLGLVALSAFATLALREVSAVAARFFTTPLR